MDLSFLGGTANGIVVNPPYRSTDPGHQERPAKCTPPVEGSWAGTPPQVPGPPGLVELRHLRYHDLVQETLVGWPGGIVLINFPTFGRHAAGVLRGRGRLPRCCRVSRTRSAGRLPSARAEAEGIRRGHGATAILADAEATVWGLWI